MFTNKYKFKFIFTVGIFLIFIFDNYSQDVKEVYKNGVLSQYKNLTDTALINDNSFCIRNSYTLIKNLRIIDTIANGKWTYIENGNIFREEFYKNGEIVDLIDYKDSLENLVRNHSFEDFSKDIPCGFYFNTDEFNKSIDHWSSPNFGKPLVYNIIHCESNFFYSDGQIFPTYI